MTGGHIELVLHCLYCSFIVVTDVVLKYFLEYRRVFFVKYQHGSDVLKHVAPSSI